MLRLFESLKTAISNGLNGRMAHVSPDVVFEAIDWTSVCKKPGGASHSIWEILNHLIYWQDYCLILLEGDNPTSPEHASYSWDSPQGSVDEQQWLDKVENFLSGVVVAKRASATELEGNLLARPEESRIEVLESRVGHNSYHLGQIVLLRQLQGSWPPPSGGNTW